MPRKKNPQWTDVLRTLRENPSGLTGRQLREKLPNILNIPEAVRQARLHGYVIDAPKVRMTENSRKVSVFRLAEQGNTQTQMFV